MPGPDIDRPIGNKICYFNVETAHRQQESVGKDGIIMIYPPGEGKSGKYLMQVWREYLEAYADSEGDVEGQILAGADRAAEILSAFSRTLDGEDNYRELIEQRSSIFEEGRRRARAFEDRLLNATFSIYNCLNTLGHQFSRGRAQAAAMIRAVDAQTHLSVEDGTQIGRSAAAMRAAFALLGLMTIAADEGQAMTDVIQRLEQRFAEAEQICASDWDHLLNALYRSVEMLQIFALLTDPELKDRIAETASRFQEEDHQKEILMKIRNGFCRFFELGHLLVTSVDATL